MSRVARGDRDAFGLLYERYKRPVMSYVYQLARHHAVAEEITQEAFLKAYRARETYRPEAKFSTWLWTIARNAALDHLRRKGELSIEDEPGADERADTPLERIESDDRGAEATLIERADESRVEECMGALTAKQREALTLRTVGELPYEEIAATMGVTLASVKTLIHRAKAALVACVGGKQA